MRLQNQKLTQEYLTLYVNEEVGAIQMIVEHGRKGKVILMKKNEVVSGRIIPNRSWTFASNILNSNTGKPSFQIGYR